MSAGSSPSFTARKRKTPTGMDRVAVPARRHRRELRLRQPHPTSGAERGWIVLVPRPRVERAVDPAGAVRGQDAPRAGLADARAVRNPAQRARPRSPRATAARRAPWRCRRRARRTGCAPLACACDRRHACATTRKVPRDTSCRSSPAPMPPDGRASHRPVVHARHPRPGALAIRGSAHGVGPGHADGRSEDIVGGWIATRDDEMKKERQQRREAPRHRRRLTALR